MRRMTDRTDRELEHKQEINKYDQEILKCKDAIGTVKELKQKLHDGYSEYLLLLQEGDTNSHNRYFEKYAATRAKFEHDISEAESEYKELEEKLRYMIEAKEHCEARYRAEEATKRADEARIEDRRIANEEIAKRDEAQKITNEHNNKLYKQSRRANHISIFLAIITAISVFYPMIKSYFGSHDKQSSVQSNASQVISRDAKTLPVPDARISDKQATKRDVANGTKDKTKTH